jgi:hypothetical protein
MRALEFATTEHPAEEIIKFLRFVCEFLNIETLPKIQLITKPITNNQAISFACFQPDSNKIRLYVKNRHILDVFRSLAHEMVHYKQNMSGRTLDGKTGSKDENEANSVAGQIMRIYGKKNPKLF